MILTIVRVAFETVICGKKSTLAGEGDGVEVEDNLTSGHGREAKVATDGCTTLESLKVQESCFEVGSEQRWKGPVWDVRYSTCHNFIRRRCYSRSTPKLLDDPSRTPSVPEFRGIERPDRAAWEGGSDYSKFLVLFIDRVRTKGGSGGRSDA